jgi:hypothetical protein
MAYDKYEDLFVDANGRPKGSIAVPESCIDSAEYIIRQIATKGARLSRGKVGPDMAADFANLSFNASTDDFLSLKKKPQDYPFADLPDVGQGIILLNKTTNDLTYNMHLGAIVARSKGRAVISHMFQQVRSYIQKPLIVIEITSAADFAKQTFGSGANLFAAGLLRPVL